MLGKILRHINLQIAPTSQSHFVEPFVSNLHDSCIVVLLVFVEKMQQIVASSIAFLAHLCPPCLSLGSKFHIGLTKDAEVYEVQEGNRRSGLFVVRVEM